MHRFVGSALMFPAAALVIGACGSSHSNSSNEQPLSDASAGDSSHADGGRAPSLVPEGGIDAAAHDASVPDAAFDASSMEAGPADARVADAVARDTGAADARPPDAAADAASMQAITDAQIVGTLEGANTGEILESLLATGTDDNSVDVGLDAGAPAFDAGAARSVNPSVIGYANMMEIDHAQSNTTLDAFGIAPAPSNMLSSVQSNTQSDMARLTPLTGSAFDMAYAQDQVALHTRLRDLVQNQLAPAAQDPQLQQYLSGTLLPLIQVHLLAANALVATLAADAGVPAPAPPGM
jgi:predicted outer membrane protein